MSEDTPKQYQVAAPYVQVRVPNWGLKTHAVGISQWACMGFKQNAVLPQDAHPDDIARLLTLEVPGGGGPMLVEFPAG